MAEAHEIGKLIGGFEVQNTLDFTGMSEESQLLTWRTFYNPLCSTVISSMFEGALCSAGLQNVYMPGSILRRNVRRFLARYDKMLEELKSAFSEVASSGEGIKDRESFILEQGGLKVYANSGDASYVADKMEQIKRESAEGAAGLARS